MAWLESHQELGNHPKVAKLARLLGISRPAAVGHLHYFWWWALDYARNGDVTRYDALQIVTGSLWDGDETLFVDAMLAAGFLERDGDRLLIHDWDEYGGKTVSRMSSNAARQRAFRERHKADEPVTPRNADVTVTSRERNVLTKQNTTVISVPDGTERERAQTAPPKPIPKAKPHRLPADWQPGERELSWALTAGYPEPLIRTETDKFRDHFTASGKTQVDWPAAWRNWLRRSAEFAPKVTPIRAGKPAVDGNLSNEQLEALMRGGAL